MKKISLEEYEKYKIVPTRLTYEEHYPTSNHYDTPNSLKIIKKIFEKKS